MVSHVYLPVILMSHINWVQNWLENDVESDVGTYFRIYHTDLTSNMPL